MTVSLNKTLLIYGRVVAQAVILRSVTVEARFQFQISLFGFYGGQGNSRTGFLPNM